MIGKVISETIAYFGSDVKRINHFLKVYSFAKTIGESEEIDEDMLEILEVTAVLHDIGIKLSEEKYNSSAGKYQEIEGPEVAESVLNRLGYKKDFIERVKYLIGHHHTYDNIDGIDYQILVEADFLVNIYEDELKKSSIENIRGKIFKTNSGTKLLEEMYL